MLGKITVDLDNCKNTIIKCLLIIAKYEPEAELYAQHDQIWFGEYEEIKNKMTVEELKILEDCSWVEDEGAWSTFF
jgi:hypothetical protein